MTEEIKTKIEKFLAELNTEVDILNCVDIEDIDLENAFDSILEMIEDNNGFDIEIIYYSRAIEYLADNDNSLKGSLALADDAGFSLESLNSEILASLLASQNARESFYECRGEIEDFFKDIVDEIEALENDEED